MAIISYSDLGEKEISRAQRFLLRQTLRDYQIPLRPNYKGKKSPKTCRYRQKLLSLQQN